MDRPNCKCHGEPMVRNQRKTKSGSTVQWDCAARRRGYNQRQYHEEGGREKKRAKYCDRKEQGLCTKCGKPSLSSTLCWDCLNQMEERRAVRI